MKRKNRKKIGPYKGYYMTLDEIAKAEGISKMQVQWAISRAILKLKKIIINNDMIADFRTLFENETQGTGTAVSPVFRTDLSKETNVGLRIHGTLDSGTLKLQTLDPRVAVSDASDSDWVDTDDTISLPSFYTLPFQRLPMRLKATSLGASANFTVDLIHNLK